MEKVWKFDNNYFIKAIKKIDKIIATKSLSESQISLLEEDKLYFYMCLGESPIIDEKKITLAEVLENIEKKMRLELKEIGVENASYLYSLSSFIARQRNETECTFIKKVDDKNEVINASLRFYREFNPNFYNILNQLVNSKIPLYNFSDDSKTEDECIFINYNQLPIVNIRDTQNMLLHIKLVHEMQHQIDGVINNKYRIKHYLRECSAIFSELIYCDKIQKENPNLIDSTSLYLSRINDIDSLSVNLKGYLDIMLMLEDPEYHLDFDTFINIFENNFLGASENYILEYVNHLAEYDLNEKIKYLFSYLVALDIRTIYQSNPKEALNIVKYIINLELYDYDFDNLKNKGIKFDAYQSGAPNHLKHTMDVETKRLNLAINTKR